MSARCLTFFLLWAFVACAAAGEAYPLWDGKEAVADYAQRVGLPPTETLDLGGGVKLELVLIPAGRFVMGTPEPKQPEWPVWFWQLFLAGGGALLLVFLTPVFWRWLRKQRRFQYSLRRYMAMMAAFAVMVTGGTRWYQYDLAWREYALARARYQAAYQYEKPAHTVTLTRPFYLGQFEVTQDQYQAVTGTNPSYFKGAANPVEMVSWDEAQEFCKRVSATTKRTVRLPTEAEWEFACRAGTKTSYYSGDKDADLDRVGWYYANSANTTHPVAQKEANAFGVYDMLGNAWEWCEDDWHENYGGAKSDGSAWVDNPRGYARVLRGGSWNGNPANCRSACRFNYYPGLTYYGVGFRVIVSVAARTP